MSPTRQRFAETVRSEPVDLTLACLLVGGEVNPDLDVDVWLARLDALAASARRFIPRGCSPAVAADGLRRALGNIAGLGGSAADFQDVRSSLLHEVLRRGHGLPLLLSVVWLAVAARLDLAAYAVALPGHVAVGIGDPEDEHVLVDPFAGGRLLTATDLARAIGLGTGLGTVPGADLGTGLGTGLPDLADLGTGLGTGRAADLQPMAPADLLVRLLTNIRVLTSRQAPGLAVTRTRLWAVELSLLLPRHPVELRRERGQLLVRLGDHLGGAEELETYAMVIESTDEHEAAVAQREARQARAQLN